MQTINGTTRLVGVVGTPLAQSLSPAMHNAAYEHLGLDWVYVPLEVHDEVGLRRLVAAVRSLGVIGFNITMPFKQAMLDLCDEVAMAASMAGAVNTVHCVDGTLIGYNTDGRGLLDALELEVGFEPADKKVVVLGAGGAAGAAVVGFVLSKAARVTVANRDVSRAEELVDRITPHLGATAAGAVSLAAAHDAVAEADLVVNATPAGMRPSDTSPVPTAWLREGQVVFDMVYGTAWTTELVAGARAVGASAVNGLGMLVGQGATAIDIWNQSVQVRAPRDVMRAAAERELAARTT